MSLCAAALATWTAVRPEGLPHSVWVRARPLPRHATPDLICDAPGGDPIGGSWRAIGTCGEDVNPVFLVCYVGAPSPFIAWIRRVCGLRTDEYVRYGPLGDSIYLSEPGSWIEYVREEG